jgi:hypothetical protein
MRIMGGTLSVLLHLRRQLKIALAQIQMAFIGF